MVRGMKIIQTSNGLMVAMPSKKSNNGTLRDVVHPLNQLTRDLIEKTVLQEYRKLCNK
jgi:stage V sporulation protein G